MKASLTTAIAGSVWLLFSAAGSAATFSALNSTTVKFNAGTSEANLIDLGAAKISFGNTTIYIGTNQVSGNNQDPIVTSFTNGIRDWVNSYDSSGIDGRGVGLLWDEASSNLYGVFTADGGSNGANSFGAATQGGWLSSYGRGGGPKASVLLKLNPDSGEAEAGTYLRSQLSSGNTNTVAPTDLDFVDGEVVFYGDAFFTPLGTDKQPFTEKTSDDGSPFAYRVVLSADLATATQAEAIGWNGVEEFSPLGSEPGGEEPGGEEPGGEEPGGEEPGGEEPGGEEPGGEEPDVESVPEPGFVIGLGALAATSLSIRCRRRSTSQSA